MGGRLHPELEQQIDAQRAWLRSDAGVSDASIRVVVSPYRVCPIGAHIDHQLGPVLGTAVSAYTVLAFAPGDSDRVRLSSANFEGDVRFALRDGASAGPDWGRYARGAAAVLAPRLPDRPRGITGRVAGSLPGGGLSSSASAILAYLTALASANDVAIDERESVRLSRRTENEFVGVASGILDPASIVGSRRGHLVAIDTREESWQRVPFGGDPSAYRILVAYTGTSRSLTGTSFNRRVDECREAAARLAERIGAPPSDCLGDFSDAVFEEHGEALPEPLRRRARHFAGERGRVLRGAERWGAGDLEGFGALVNASCRSSIENYETGSEELIRLQELLVAAPGVYGARFSGAGFGGCCIALVASHRAEEVRASVERDFRGAFPALRDRARVFLVEAEDGVRLT